MKKTNIILLALIIAVFPVQAQDTIVGWTFPDNSADSLSDAGIPANLDKYIITSGGTGTIEYKNGVTTKAAQASSWENGNGLKYWQIAFSTLNFDLLLLSSRQSSGGNDPGPKDFKVQYSVDSALSWTDISIVPIIVANDWTTGVLNNLLLPFECTDKNLVFIRWIMTSDIASDSTLLLSSGKSKIDDIFITGVPYNFGFSENNKEIKSTVFPNPSKNLINISGEGAYYHIDILNTLGMIVMRFHEINSIVQIDISSLEKGSYFIVIRDDKLKKQKVERIIKY